MKYINVSDKDLTLPGIGKVKAGGVIQADETFRNANFERYIEIKMPEAKKKRETKKNKK